MKLEHDIKFIKKRMLEQQSEMDSLSHRVRKNELTVDRYLELHDSAHSQLSYFMKLKENHEIDQEWLRINKALY